MCEYLELTARLHSEYHLTLHPGEEWRHAGSVSDECKARNSLYYVHPSTRH